MLALIVFMCYQQAFAQSTDSLGVYPNPFNHSTTIHFELAHADTVSLHVYSMAGALEVTYFDSFYLAGGVYNLPLNGDSLAVGVYLVRLQIGSTKLINKIASKIASAGIEEQQIATFTAFPNPVESVLNIPYEGGKTLVFIDERGRIVKTITTSEHTVDVQNLPAGVYYTTITSEGKQIHWTQKIIKR